MNAPRERFALPLKDEKLFRQQCYVDGQWADADSKQTVVVSNPATGAAVGTIPRMGAAETRRAGTLSRRIFSERRYISTRLSRWPRASLPASAR